MSHYDEARMLDSITIPTYAVNHSQAVNQGGRGAMCCKCLVSSIVFELRLSNAANSVLSKSQAAIVC